MFDFCLPVIIKALPRGAPLPPELDEFFVLASPYEAEVQKVLAKIPPARRLGIFEREIARGEVQDVERIARRHLHLAPDATPRAGLVAIDFFRKKNARIRALALAYEKGFGAAPFAFVDPTPAGTCPNG